MIKFTPYWLFSCIKSENPYAMHVISFNNSISLGKTIAKMLELS